MTVDGTVTQLASTDRSYFNELLYLPGPAGNVDVNDRSWPFDPPILEQRPLLIVGLPPTNGTTWQLLAIGAADAGWEKPFVRAIAADGTSTDFHFDEFDALGQSQGYGPSGSQGFAVAPDGALWLARDAHPQDPGGDAIIGRLTADGSFSEMTLTRGISSIAVDAEGNVWFTTRPPRDARGPVQALVARMVVHPPAAGGAPVPTIPPDASGCVPGVAQGTIPAGWPRSLAVLGGPVCATTTR
jgi:streptogramin lyase